MNKTIIDVPPGIRFISDWKEFNLPDFPCIVDKQITGCGFTEWVINSPHNMILSSPRLILLENKAEQHPGEVFYARNDLDSILNIDRDLSKSLSTVKKFEDEQEKLKKDFNIEEKKAELRKQIRNYVIGCMDEERPCKILVTYDSYRLVYETLNNIGCFEGFHTIVDEFQSIFTDSRFKSDTELEFVNVLRNVQKLCFVSATPTIDTYLEMLDEFRDLPYYEMRWETLDPDRVISPEIDVHPCKRLSDMAIKIIQSYQEGNFEKTIIRKESGELVEVESKELVIYVNSVKNICDIIRKAGLKYENTNVLCSNSSSNQKKIRSAFGLGKGEVGGIGKVPLRDEPRKMFTLCTRTVYLGADFYSDCARSIILSDANIECLAVDITLDLPQILGRQRLEENPWKNRAELYAKFLSDSNKKTVDEFKKYLNKKINRTKNLLSIYNSSTNNAAKHDLAENYQKVAKTYNYKDDFVAVNTHNGKDLQPAFNNLVMVSELRAFEIQQIDFADRVRAFNTINSTGKIRVNENSTNEVRNFMIRFNSLKQFSDKMKLLCTTKFSENRILNIILKQIHIDYSTYYNVLGPERIKSLSYQKSRLSMECNNLINNSSITKENIASEFKKMFLINNKYTLSDIKKIISNIYSNLGLNKSPKAVDILEYFDVLRTRAKDSTGTFVAAYKILKLKDNE